MKSLLLTLLFPILAFSQTNIYRSIQNNTSTIWTSGGSLSLTVIDTIATFTADAPDSIGRGVAIQYDSVASVTTNAICFIKYRISKRKFGVQRFNGGTPPQTTIPSTLWSAFHTYITWENLHNGVENTGIAALVSNFDVHTDGINIDARGEYWRVGFYAGTHSITGTQGGDDINTSATEKLELYAPCGTKWVGVTQRSTTGKLTFRGAVLTSTADGWPDNDDAGTRVCQHWNMIGLQFQVTTITGGRAVIINNAAAEAAVINITDCIFVGSDSVSTTAGSHCAIQWSSGTTGGSTVYVKNSLFYNWKTAGATTHEGGFMLTSTNQTLTALINNCTFYKCEVGVKRSNAGNTLTIKNCIFNRVADGMNGGVGGNNNVSNISSDCASCTAGITGTVAFTSQSTGDFSLQSGDTVAKNAGADLSSDTVPVTNDFIGSTRSGSYDCGFLEQGATEAGCRLEVDPASGRRGGKVIFIN